MYLIRRYGITIKASFPATIRSNCPRPVQPLQNIVDRSPAEEYTSVIYQRTKTAEEFVATICADIPASCKVKLALRSADSVPGLQSVPFQPIETGKNISVKDFSGKYLQYRLQLISRDGINTPKVRSVTFTF